MKPNTTSWLRRPARSLAIPILRLMMGLHYDLQVPGEFVLTRSTVAGDSFDVQIRTSPLDDRPAASIISQVAVKLGDHRVSFDLGACQAMSGSMVTRIVEPRQPRYQGGRLKNRRDFADDLSGDLEHRRDH
jgi:hypothetical protein